jgi:hypothetical protein
MTSPAKPWNIAEAQRKAQRAAQVAEPIAADAPITASEPLPQVNGGPALSTLRSLRTDTRRPRPLRIWRSGNCAI